MTHEEILEKAIVKAIDNGLDEGSYRFPNTMTIENRWSWLTRSKIAYAIIFDKEFARAFWGEEEQGWMDEELNLEGDGKPFKAWQYHLRRMVIEDDPIRYLESFLK